MALNRQIVAGLLIAACLLAVPFAAPYLGGNYVVTLATRVVIFAIAASSLDLLIGRGALVSFGHAAYFGLGGYVVGISAFHLANDVTIFGWAGSNEALVVWPLAMLVSGFAALVIGALSLRTSGVYFIMITLAFAQMIYFVFVALKYYGGDDGLAMTSRNLFGGRASPMRRPSTGSAFARWRSACSSSGGSSSSASAWRCGGRPRTSGGWRRWASRSMATASSPSSSRA